MVLHICLQILWYSWHQAVELHTPPLGSGLSCVTYINGIKYHERIGMELRSKNKETRDLVASSPSLHCPLPSSSSFFFSSLIFFPPSFPSSSPLPPFFSNHCLPEPSHQVRNLRYVRDALWRKTMAPKHWQAHAKNRNLLSNIHHKLPGSYKSTFQQYSRIQRMQPELTSWLQLWPLSHNHLPNPFQIF